MRTRLAVGVFSPSVLLRIAREIGALDQHGLDIDEVPVSSSPAQFRALAAGELHAALTSPDNVIAYRFDPDNPLGRRADARILSAVDRGLGLALYARPGVTSAADLRGGTLGVDVPSSGFAFAMYALAESLGLHRSPDQPDISPNRPAGADSDRPGGADSPVRPAGAEDGGYRVVALGSTPRRLTALLAGECAATMLNAGNELIADENGCLALARVSQTCTPYLGTVLAVVGDAHGASATRLAAALRTAALAICSGELDELATAQAGTALGVGPGLARRYVDRLKDPDEGLVTDGLVDPAALWTIVDLRRRYRPGPAPLDEALRPDSGLVAPSAISPASP